MASAVAAIDAARIDNVVSGADGAAGGGGDKEAVVAAHQLEAADAVSDDPRRVIGENLTKGKSSLVCALQRKRRTGNKERDKGVELVEPEPAMASLR